jgi:hypothetical protein
MKRKNWCQETYKVGAGASIRRFRGSIEVVSFGGAKALQGSDAALRAATRLSSKKVPTPHFEDYLFLAGGNSTWPIAAGKRTARKPIQEHLMGHTSVPCYVAITTITVCR